MSNRKGQISLVAEQYGKTPEYVKSVIRRHPEYGIRLENGKPTVIEANQLTALCSELDKLTAPPTLPTYNSLQPTYNEPTTNLQPTLDSCRLEIEALRKENEELRKQLAEARTSAAVAEARAEERKGQIDALDERIRAMVPVPLLEAAKSEATAAREEAESYEPWHFGLFRKNRR